MLLLVVVVGLIAGCGADDQDGPSQTATQTSDRVRVADARFDGEFLVSNVTIDGQDVPLVSVATVAIETVFGALTVEPGCNQYFGSFTFGEDRSASFTIAGGSNEVCGELAAQEEAILAVLRTATSWEAVGGQADDGQAGDGFVLDGADGTIALTRP